METAAPTRVIDRKTRQEITDSTAPTATAFMDTGEARFSLLAHEMGVVYSGMLYAAPSHRRQALQRVHPAPPPVHPRPPPVLPRAGRHLNSRAKTVSSACSIRALSPDDRPQRFLPRDLRLRDVRLRPRARHPPRLAQPHHLRLHRPSRAGTASPRASTPKARSKTPASAPPSRATKFIITTAPPVLTPSTATAPCSSPAPR